MRLLAIGDVHGQLDRLKTLLGSLCLQHDDQLVMLGDYIDRGPDSSGVIDTLIQLKMDYPHTIFLRGNHEQMLLDTLFELGIVADWKPLRAYVGSPDLSMSTDTFLYEANGGLATLLSYMTDSKQAYRGKTSAYQMIPQEHIEFLMQTTFHYRYLHYLFVHAGINEADPLGEKYGPYDLLWRRKVDTCRLDGRELTVVHGHTPCVVPLFNEREINLDTGAGHGRVLSCCDVRTGKIWQA